MRVTYQAEHFIRNCFLYLQRLQRRFREYLHSSRNYSFHGLCFPNEIKLPVAPKFPIKIHACCDISFCEGVIHSHYVWGCILIFFYLFFLIAGCSDS